MTKSNFNSLNWFWIEVWQPNLSHKLRFTLSLISSPIFPHPSHTPNSNIKPGLSFNPQPELQPQSKWKLNTSPTSKVTLKFLLFPTSGTSLGHTLSMAST